MFLGTLLLGVSYRMMGCIAIKDEENNLVRYCFSDWCTVRLICQYTSLTEELVWIRIRTFMR
jgi:hypothetical protein